MRACLWRTLAISASVLFLASLVLVSSSWPTAATAKPPGPEVFCDVYPEAPACAGGAVECSMCHFSPPARNVFGEQVASFLAPGLPRPLSDEDFAAALPGALAMAAELDADGDGATNAQEIATGTIPSNADSFPADLDCALIDQSESRLRFDVCGYDERYAYRKLLLDTCGRSPTREEMDALAAEDDKLAYLDGELDRCVQTNFWRGRDGVLWNLANRKIGPIRSVKSGEGAGDIPLADYLDDYNLFVFTQIDGRDARELLTGQYIVSRDDGDPTTYEAMNRSVLDDVNERGTLVGQLVNRRDRAGMLTTRWFLMTNTMFTAVPRTTAAQAYRSYLGYDIALLEGLEPVEGEPMDYDNKGVAAEECAVCHSTLDPLTYPFTRYEGIGGGEAPFPATYAANRLEGFIGVEGEGIIDTPEAGMLFGQEVRNVREWGEVAANSDAFAQAIVRDYWELFLGEGPRPDETAEFEAVWRAFRDEHDYSVEAMLHDLIRTEAYGVP